RPDNADEDVALRRRQDGILEVALREHRLVLPEHRLDLEEACKLAFEPADDDRCTPPLIPDITWRGYEEPHMRSRRRAHCPAEPDRVTRRRQALLNRCETNFTAGQRSGPTLA